MESRCTPKRRSYLYTPWRGSIPYCTIPEKLKMLAEQDPHKEALVFVGEDHRVGVTFAQIVNKSEEIAKKLMKIGIKKNDVVAVHDDKSPNWLYCTFGVQMCGAWPFHYRFQRNDGSDVVPIFKRMKCKAIITQPGEENCNLNTIKSFVKFKADGQIDSKCLPSLKTVIFTSNPSDFDDGLIVKDIPTSADEKLPEVEPEDIAAIFCSSGSTGPPKLISWCHANLLLLEMIGSEGLFYKYNEPVFCDRTFGWIAGYPREIFGGITRVTTSSTLKEKTLKDLCNSTVRIINEENCRHAILFSSTIDELLKGNYRMKPLETILSGGGPITSKDTEVVGKFCHKFINLYASTENGGITLNVTTDKQTMKNYDTGVPFPLVEVKVVDKDGLLSKLGTPGEIYVRSKITSTGYLKEEQEWHKLNRKEGYWHKTGDIGYVSENGHLFVTGRTSESIIIEGAIFLPSQYEDILKQNPCVEDAVAFGIPDEIFFQVAGVAVTLKEGKTKTVEQLLQFFQEKKDENFDESFYPSKFAPQIVLYSDKFPLTSNGKIARTQVKEKALEMIISRKINK